MATGSKTPPKPPVRGWSPQYAYEHAFSLDQFRITPETLVHPDGSTTGYCLTASWMHDLHDALPGGHSLPPIPQTFTITSPTTGVTVLFEFVRHELGPDAHLYRPARRRQNIPVPHISTLQQTVRVLLTP